MAESLSLARSQKINFLYCSECEAPIALTESHERRAREDSKVTFFCPYGHSQHFGRSELTRAREMLAEQTRVATEMVERARLAEVAEESHRQARMAAEGALKREKSRAIAGLCPCCNRTFTQLARHMKTKHPDAKS